MLWIILIIVLLVFSFFFIGFPKENEDAVFGVNFSQKHTENFGLDWKETYLAILDDLKPKEIKIATHWDLIEPKEGEYSFGDLDWQVSAAKERGSKILLVVGMKTPRWPECHIPEWAKELNKEERREKVLSLVEKTVKKYKDNDIVWAFQVENEPFFPFGECPEFDEELFKKEVDLVNSLTEKPVIITESGEFPLWFKAAKYGDMVGVTMYRKVWFKEFNSYFFLKN